MKKRFNYLCINSIFKKYNKDILTTKEIRKFFGFDNENSFLRKSIKVPPITKLEWLEENRKAICRLPHRIGRWTVEELKHIR